MGLNSPRWPHMNTNSMVGSLVTVTTKFKILTSVHSSPKSAKSLIGRHTNRTTSNSEALQVQHQAKSSFQSLHNRQGLNRLQLPRVCQLLRRYIMLNRNTYPIKYPLPTHNNILHQASSTTPVIATRRSLPHSRQIKSNSSSALKCRAEWI